MRCYWQKIVSGFALFALALGFVVPVDASAAALSALRVTTTGSGTLSMAPGEVKSVVVTFQNSGTTTWKNDGAGYISLYTHGPKYRKSVFDPGSWLSPTQVKRMRESTVAPGGVATIGFDLHAPSTTGTYAETFALASESVAWIDGGEFTLNITVKQPTPVSSSSSTSVTTAPTAKLSLVSANRLSLKAGKSAMLTAGFTNTGTASWTSHTLIAPDVSMASGTSFANSSWNGNVLTTGTGTIKPGATAYLTFSVTAPKANGIHTAKFQLTA